MHEWLMPAIFYFFAAMALAFALIAVTQHNPVRAVLALVVVFYASTVLWLLVQAEFLALIQILVYVGAVMTLFLFVVMMLNIDLESMKMNIMRYLPFGLLAVALLTGLLLVALPKETFNNSVQLSVAVGEVLQNMSDTDTPPVLTKPLSNTEGLGMVLYTDYVFAFELAAVILLAAIISAITLVHRAPIRSKQQDIVQQILTKRKDRVTLIKMKPE